MNHKPQKVLLIEDNPGDVRLISVMLADADAARSAISTIELVHADRLSTGLKRLSEGGIDVILLDLSLPESQGLDTLGKVHAQAPDVPMVVLTGLNDVMMAIKAVREGAQDYLIKEQVDGNLLVRSMWYAIERHRIIAELKRTEEELQQYVNELKLTQNVMLEREKLSIIGQMAAGMAHEIRNPLTSIKGFAQLLSEKYPNNETLKSYVEIILGEVEQANRVITDFLQLTRPKQPVLKRQSVNNLVKETIEIVGPQGFLNSIEVQYEDTKNLPHCMIDRDQIKQVILNICQNAIEAMPGGGLIIIRTGLLTKENEIYVDIQDTGCGIPHDKLENIGVPFFTTKGNGTGLGLCISYAIINNHTGRVEVISKEGEGTRFRFYLPCG